MSRAAGIEDVNERAEVLIIGGEISTCIVVAKTAHLSRILGQVHNTMPYKKFSSSKII